MSLTKLEKDKRKKERLEKLYNEKHKTINNKIYKRCSCHKEYFPEGDEWMPCTEEYFYKTKSSTDGLFPYCKKCTSKKSAMYQHNHKKEALEYHHKYSQTHPNYYKNIRDNYEKRNKENRKESIKQWRRNHPDRLRQYNSIYSNKKHNITTKEWKDCKEYFNYQCAYCGMPEKEAKELYKQNLHKEHVDCNGVGNLSNCVPACKHCNTSKHEFDMEDWYKQQSYFSQERLDKIYKWLKDDYKLYIKNK